MCVHVLIISDLFALRSLVLTIWIKNPPQIDVKNQIVVRKGGTGWSCIELYNNKQFILTSQWNIKIYANMSKLIPTGAQCYMELTIAAA